MKTYSGNHAEGTVLDHGRITAVNPDYIEIVRDGETEPDRITTVPWIEFHGEPVVGQRVDVVATKYDDYYKRTFWGFVPEGFKPKSAAALKIEEAEKKEYENTP